jgi:hypothetical protein
MTRPKQSPRLCPSALVAVLLALGALACGVISPQASAQAPVGPQPPPSASAPSGNQTPPTPAPAAEGTPGDHHNGVSVSARPCTDPDLAKEKFGKANPLPVGILPVEVFLRNETNSPFRVDLGTVQLALHARSHSQSIGWLAIREVATAIAHPHGPPSPHQPRFPTIGVPTGADSKTDKLVAILEPLALDADVLPPQSMLHGFLFFDLDRDLSLAEDASLYVPDVTTIPGNKPLMFFEVSLNAPAKP